MAGRTWMIFKDFGYKVIRLKYFIIITGALILEIATLTLYLLKLQNIVDFELFNLSILYGAISGIIVILAIGILVLMKVDRKRDVEKIKKLRHYQKEYRLISAEHLNEINKLIRAFENETKSLDTKLAYAELLEKKYGDYLKQMSCIEIPDFLNYAHSCECEHLSKEMKLYSGFISLVSPQELKDLGNASEISHNNFLREMHGLEKSLRLII